MNDFTFERRIAKQALLEWRSSKAPIERVLQETIREHRVGSKQRPEVSRLVFDLIRFWPTYMGGWAFDPSQILETRRLDEALKAIAPLSREEIVEQHKKVSPRFESDQKRHLQRLHGMQSFLLDRILKLSDAQIIAWHDYLHESFFEAPVALRIVASKIAAKDFVEKFSALHPESSQFLPDCYRFHERHRFADVEGLEAGSYEIQDESSQLLAHVANVQDGERVLDLCAGAGGKALHFAALMKGRGEICCYDIAKSKLQELVKRSRTAGFSNIRVLNELPAESEKFDLVVIDAPCSGLGTLRRSPDRLFRMQENELDQLFQIQRDLVKKGLARLKKGGRLLYATCSVLPDENFAVVNQVVQSEGRKWGNVDQSLASSLGVELSAKLLTEIRASSAAKIAGPLPAGALQLGPSPSQASGAWQGDGFFIALVK